jgi:flagellar protein FlaG
MTIDGVREESVYDQIVVPQKERSVANAETRQPVRVAKNGELNVSKADQNGTRGREAEVSNETLTSALELANARLASTNAQLQYSIHEATNRLMVKIVDKETQEVIREVPPQKTLDMFAKILELAGLLVDQKQ